MTRQGLPRRPTQRFLAAILLELGIFSAAHAGNVIYGINFDVISTDTQLIPNCATDPNATVHGQAFMARYTKLSVRDAVRAELKTLRASGFRVVRSIVQLFPGDHPSGDLTNIYKLDDGVLEAAANYVRDVRDAGFDSLIIAFDTQGSASPGCRNKEWGDCFDLATVSSSVDAEERVMRAAHSVSGISVRVDLLNEACISKVIPPLLSANFVVFIRAASKMHAATFPDIPVTVSCQIERSADGLAATMRLMAESGDRMSFIDVHAYPGTTRIEADTLSRAAQSIGAAKLPFIFGETSYADPGYQRSIVSAYQEAFHGTPQQVIFWPVHSLSNHCHFDVAQPYQLNQALGH
jgi:hypothetical protein